MRAEHSTSVPIRILSDSRSFPAPHLLPQPPRLIINMIFLGGSLFEDLKKNVTSRGLSLPVCDVGVGVCRVIGGCHGDRKCTKSNLGQQTNDYFNLEAYAYSCIIEVLEAFFSVHEK